MRVIGPDGKPLPSQRLSSLFGLIAFLACDVPPFGSLKFTTGSGEPLRTGSAGAEGKRIWNENLSLEIDEKTGAISSLKLKGIPVDLVDTRAGMGLDDYFYVPGTDPKDAKRSGKVNITVDESGPVVASLLIKGEAPGCKELIRKIRVVDGLDQVQITDTVLKEKIRTKEGVHFAFPFNVPGGTMRMDIPWAVARPEADQIPGSCKNWFTVQRWVDISNDDFGVTWATVDAPLVEVGAITAETPWIRKLEPSQTFYSYVMNNYWHTNYKADQEGLVQFRYVLRPHRGPFSGVEAARFGIEASQDLIVVPAKADAPAITPSRLRVEPESVLVTCLKPADDKKGLVIRLFGAGGQDAKASLAWSDPRPESLWISNLAEDRVEKAAGSIEVPAWGIVTLRADFKTE